MKLIIQIPCYNESETLPAVLDAIPLHIEGISEIESLVIDDGSGDDTAEVAKRHGGGGHPLASGANAKDESEINDIILELEELAIEWQNTH